jgi:spore germination protein KC
MKKSFLLYILCVFLFIMLTGCWNRRELNTLAIVQALGIDRTENGQISITAEILRPGEVKGASGTGGEAVWVVTSTGETVFDAIRNASLKTTRKLYFPHNKVIIIGEETARAGVKPLLDFLGRDPEIRRRSYIFIARGKAKPILQGVHEQENIPSHAIEGSVQGTKASSKIPKRILKDFLETIDSRTSSSVVPGILLLEKSEGGQSIKVVALDQTAIFKKDKLIGWFDGRETRGLLWILNEVKSGIIIVKSPKEENKNVSLEIIQTTSKIKPEIKDEKLTITVEIKEEGNLAEQMSEVNLTQPEYFHELEIRQAAVIKEEVNAALTKAQAWGVDIFKFGEEFHRKFPQEWSALEQNWEEEFKELEVNVEVVAQLRRVGITTTPPQTEESEKKKGEE